MSLSTRSDLLEVGMFASTNNLFFDNAQIGVLEALQSFETLHSLFRFLARIKCIFRFAPASDGERRRGEGSKWRPSCLTRSITLSCLTRAIGLATERQTTDTSQAPPPGSSRESCRSRPRLP